MGKEFEAVAEIKMILAQSDQACFDNCLDFGRLSSNQKQSQVQFVDYFVRHNFHFDLNSFPGTNGSGKGAGIAAQEVTRLPEILTHIWKNSVPKVTGKPCFIGGAVQVRAVVSSANAFIGVVAAIPKNFGGFALVEGSETLTGIVMNPFLDLRKFHHLQHCKIFEFAQGFSSTVSLKFHSCSKTGSDSSQLLQIILLNQKTVTLKSLGPLKNFFLNDCSFLITCLLIQIIRNY